MTLDTVFRIALMGQNHIGAIEVPKMRSDNPQMAPEADSFPGSSRNGA